MSGHSVSQKKRAAGGPLAHLPKLPPWPDKRKRVIVREVSGTPVLPSGVVGEWGGLMPGRWLGTWDGRTSTVMGWCDICHQPKPARDIKIRQRPFGRGEVRTCGNH